MARREVGLDLEAEQLLAGAVERMALTGRGFDRALKVARTIADLAGADRVGAGHLAEALSYRNEPGGEDLARAG
jgi:magnesium chelatase family protein